MSHIQPADPTIPRIHLAVMPQLAEAIRSEDDWTGINDAATRRRAQTRLNTRAYRKRKALALAKNLKGLSSSDTAGPPTQAQEALVECWDVSQECVSIVPVPQSQQLYSAKNPLLPSRDHPQSEEQRSQLVFPLSADHLITLLQYNVLRALAANRTLVSGILTTPLDCEIETIHILPYPANPKLIPSTLLPTTLQQTVPHGDWVDVFPCPVARDRLISAAGTYDEDELWADCIGGLFEGFPDDEVERRGLIVWSPTWDITGWEMSEGFLQKWGWLFHGVPQALEATNRWRKDRGEEPLQVALEG
ncbi:hypothetical protein BJX64DRAFT_270500 [Aspergillus heterothallicus]